LGHEKTLDDKDSRLRRVPLALVLQSCAAGAAICAASRDLVAPAPSPAQTTSAASPPCRSRRGVTRVRLTAPDTGLDVLRRHKLHGVPKPSNCDGEDFSLVPFPAVATCSNRRKQSHRSITGRHANTDGPAVARDSPLRWLTRKHVLRGSNNSAQCSYTSVHLIPALRSVVFPDVPYCTRMRAWRSQLFVCHRKGYLS
jgi:hypothetical protein